MWDRITRTNGLIGIQGQNAAYLAANMTGKYRDFNTGVYVGELPVTPDVRDSVDIVVYKLR